MLKFLLDENLSHETVDYLNSLGCDAKTAVHFGLGGAEDSQVARKAAATKRILITFDSDFGEIFYFGSKQKRFGVVILRPKNQTVEEVNEILQRLLESRILERKEMRDALIIVGEKKIRIRKRPS